jgi:hypothetical protein
MSTPSTCCGKSGQGCVWYAYTSLPPSHDSTNSAKAHLKPGALAARNLLFNARAKKQRPKTLSLDLDAHAVCC